MRRGDGDGGGSALALAQDVVSMVTSVGYQKIEVPSVRSALPF